MLFSLSPWRNEPRLHNFTHLSGYVTGFEINCDLVKLTCEYFEAAMVDISLSFPLRVNIYSLFAVLYYQYHALGNQLLCEQSVPIKQNSVFWKDRVVA